MHMDSGGGRGGERENLFMKYESLNKTFYYYPQAKLPELDNLVISKIFSLCA